MEGYVIIIMWGCNGILLWGVQSLRRPPQYPFHNLPSPNIKYYPLFVCLIDSSSRLSTVSRQYSSSHFTPSHTILALYGSKTCFSYGDEEHKKHFPLLERRIKIDCISISHFLTFIYTNCPCLLPYSIFIPIF